MYDLGDHHSWERSSLCKNINPVKVLKIRGMGAA